MTESTVLLDPTGEVSPVRRERLPRTTDLTGLTVGLLDISKARGDVFLDEIERRLRERGLEIRRYQKPTFARVAPLELRQQISGECDVVIEALAD
jgi:hypothetical protein